MQRAREQQENDSVMRQGYWSFFTAKRPALTSSISCTNDTHILRNDRSKIVAFQQPLSQDAQIASATNQLHEETTQRATERLSSNQLNELAKQIGCNQIGPCDSVSQVGSESSVAKSLATHSKREGKAATESSGMLSEVGSKLGNRPTVKEVREEDW